MSGRAYDAAGARLEKLRGRLCIDAPFYGALSLFLKLECDRACETMATDGTRLIYAPAFVNSLPDDELTGVIVHEVAHCSMGHHVRRAGRDLKAWNVACDYAVNAWVLSAGFKLPPDRLYDARFANMGAEEIFATLARETRQQQQQNAPGQGASNSQGNASGQGAPGAGASGGAPSWGAVLDAAPDHDAAGRAEADALWTQRVRTALLVAAKGEGEGRSAGALRRLASDLDAPRHNWRDVLRRYADNGSRREHSWRRPNRRFAASGLHLPALVPDNPARVVFCVDSSGSMDAPAIAALFSEAAGMLETGAIDRATVVLINTAVERVEEFDASNAADLAEFMPAPSGGTRFAPAFEWIAENAPDASAIIYATDLDCADYGDAPAAPLLWLKTPTRRAMPAPPFGEIMLLDPDAQ
jgi:predicted metal-dependent peptidase